MQTNFDNLNAEDMRNEIEIRAYGLMRNGNHAIIKWIQDQYPGMVTCFLNNIRHGDHDPYTNFTQLKVTGVDEGTDIEKLRLLKKQLLIYSYEDRADIGEENTEFLQSVYSLTFEENRIKYLGQSRHYFDVAILRDPFNGLASRYAMIQEQWAFGGISKMETIAANWKAIARQALEWDEHPSETTLVILYNNWVQDVLYRKKLSEKLLGHHNDTSVDKLSDFGGGSSFTETNAYRFSKRDLMAKWYKIFKWRHFKKIGQYGKRLIAPKVEKQVFFERWRKLEKDPAFRKIFRDEEILTLSESLFGELPGTREFVRSIKKSSRT